MRKIKKITIKIWEALVALLRLPHMLIMAFLVMLAVASLVTAYRLQATSEFVSSVFSNIFAGLVTGIAVCLISGVKSIVAYNNQGKIEWLNSIHRDFLIFNQHYRNVLRKVGKESTSKEDLYDEIYDVLCEGNNIPATIAQSQHDKKLPFNPYKYFLKNLDYDAIEHMKRNNNTRDIIMKLDISTLTHDNLMEIFADMEHSLFTLNGAVISKIRELEIKQNIANKFFL